LDWQIDQAFQIYQNPRDKLCLHHQGKDMTQHPVRLAYTLAHGQAHSRLWANDIGGRSPITAVPDLDSHWMNLKPVSA